MDRNTTYFYATVNANRRKQVSRLWSYDKNNAWTIEKDIIHDSVVQYFNSQLIEEPIEEDRNILKVIPMLITPRTTPPLLFPVLWNKSKK